MDRSLKSRIKQTRYFLKILFIKLLRLPHDWFSEKVQATLKYWSFPMLWVFVRSLGNEVYIDQPCRYSSFSNQPKTNVDKKYQLSSDQIESFHKNGFIGPLRAVSEDEMSRFRKNLEKVLKKKSASFGMKTVRDRHLDDVNIRELFQRPEIIERVAQFLGPDLLIWRSQVFNQEPGSPPIEWHQASTYMLENFKAPILFPENRNELFQLTIWIAVDEATIENGCMYFVPGTHDKIRTLKRGGETQFYDARFILNHKIDQNDIVYMPLKPGEFVIFSERVIHGSPGNNSDKRRMGINFRAINPSTAVYPNQKKHYAMHLRQTWDLSSWGCLLIRGKDRYRKNKVFFSE